MIMKKIFRFSTSDFQQIQGISIIELILVVTIISLLSVSTFSFGSSFLTRNQLKNKTNELVSSLRNAQINSVSSKGQNGWGVEVTSGQIKLYMQGDASFDQTFAIPQNVSITEGNVVFDPLTGNPDTTYVFVLSNTLGESRTVSLNEVGCVDVN
jgi:Tfp pilus assembly protein FimT